MPVVFRENGVRFHFYSDEGTPREPIHIHASEAGREAKFWLFPKVRLARKMGYNDREIAALTRIVEANRDRIEQRWHDHFGNP